MKKIILSTMVAVLSSAATFATGLTEGFYRVQNYGSGRYLYVRDCTGSVSTLGSDMGALELWANLDDAISDPGSVMFLKKYGSSWDITSQNTGVYQISGYYMGIYQDANGFCQVSASGQYLYEVGTSDIEEGMGLMGAKTSSEMPGKTNYRLWLTPKVDSSTDCYFGFKPTVTANGKSYAPFYAAFAYTPKNGNVKTWYVTKVDKEKGIAVVKEITGTVAKGQAVFVECAGSATADNKVDLTVDAGNAATSNLMKGTYFCNGTRSKNVHSGDPALVEFNASTMRVLGTDANGDLAFVNSSTNMTSTKVWKSGAWARNVACIPHNTSYLVVDTDCPATLKVMTEEEYDKTGIINITVDTTPSSIYTVSGIKTNKMLKGQLYISGGKKFINK